MQNPSSKKFRSWRRTVLSVWVIGLSMRWAGCPAAACGQSDLPTVPPQLAKIQQTAKHAVVPAAVPIESADASAGIDLLLTRLVLENIPHTFEETKDWGGQALRWDGVKIRRDGVRLETQRRKKLVNHGTWKKYSAELRNPAEEFSIQVKNMRETRDGVVAFDVHFTAHLNIAGRQSKWVKGVQLYSLSAHGHTQVRLKVAVELEVTTDARKFPPDLVFVPHATDAELVVEEFRLDRIGKAGGEFAQQVSRGVRSKLDEKIAEKNHKLLEKINRQLDKKQDEFRISIADAVESRWTKVAQPVLPPSVQKALGDNSPQR